jgi:acetylornithine deacetylase/succinyl-diaminopimelate desuccinylase-like protein
MDMKSQTAAEVAAACTLAQEGWRPAAGDLVVISVMDEEVDGSGAIWLCGERPDLVRCDYLLNEGDGAITELEGGRRYGMTLGEKGVFRFTLVTDGAAGHASMPNIADNALLKLAPLLERMATREPGWDVTAVPRALFAQLGLRLDGDPGAALAALARRAPELATFVEPMLKVTLAPTMVSASRDYNVIPAQARLAVDCRVPPGMDEAAALARVREVLGEDGYRLELTERTPGNASAPASPLMGALEAWLARADPEAAGFLPVISTGYSDSVTFRAAFPDVVAYGFFPLRHMPGSEAARLIHGRDERVDARDRAGAPHCTARAPRTLLGG